MTPQAGSILFLDTNILLNATDLSRPGHSYAGDIFSAALKRGFHLAISGQIIREYLVVATRTVDENGLGLPPEDAAANIETFTRRTVLLEESYEVAEHLVWMVRNYKLKGKRIHDANVAATMKVHSVSLLITENPEDFKIYDEVSVIDPRSINYPAS